MSGGKKKNDDKVLSTVISYFQAAKRLFQTCQILIEMKKFYFSSRLELGNRLFSLVKTFILNIIYFMT